MPFPSYPAAAEPQLFVRELDCNRSSESNQINKFRIIQIESEIHINIRNNIILFVTGT